MQLTTFISFGLGYCLFTLLIMALYQVVRLIQVQELQNVGLFIVGMIFTIGGIFGALVTGFGDFIHYMNRDVPDWIYSVEGYLILMVSFAFIMQICSTRFTPTIVTDVKWTNIKNFNHKSLKLIWCLNATFERPRGFGTPSESLNILCELSSPSSVYEVEVTHDKLTSKGLKVCYDCIFVAALVNTWLFLYWWGLYLSPIFRNFTDILHCRRQDWANSEFFRVLNCSIFQLLTNDSKHSLTFNLFLCSTITSTLYIIYQALLSYVYSIAFFIYYLHLYTNIITSPLLFKYRCLKDIALLLS